ncbi:MAG: transcription termination factor Rho [Flaviflexus sp.]|nr:transcription termination factor Rho [Flaviflexus sp.]
MSDNSSAPRKALTAMRLSELQELAAELGITIEGKRRNDYITAIREVRPTRRGRPPAKKKDETTKSAPAEATDRQASETTDSAKAEGKDDGKKRGKADRAKSEGGETAPAESAEPAEGKDKRSEKSSEDRRRRRGSDVEIPADKQAALDALADAATSKRAEHSDDDDSDHRRRRGRDRGRGRGRNDRNDRNDRHDRHDRNDRGNDRRDNRRGRDNDSDFNDQVRDGDVLLKVGGILDIDGNNAYLRTAGYLPGPNDAYVSQALIKKNKLRRGDAIVGAVRDLGESPNQRGRQRHKYNPLVQIDSVNGLTMEDLARRPEFGKLTPLYPNEMLRMETSPKAITPRVIDLVAPIGKGQRGLIVSPPKAGKTMIMQQIANAIAVNNPRVHLMVVLVDERPEEVTDMQRVVQGEVIASTFDRPASDHTMVAELAIERAKRLVELGQDVVVLLDSITRLGRAYNLAAPASGRILSGGVDAGALYPPKRFFGAARNIENGGSLTIVASALVETGSKMDEVIFEEFKGTGNMELRLSRQLADRRIFPAVDINASGTRREELLFSPEELKIVWQLRRALGTLEVNEASDFMLGRIRKTESNGEFLMSIAKSMHASGANND